MMQSRPKWLNLLGAFLNGLVAGNFYLLNNFSIYMLSYIYNYDKSITPCYFSSLQTLIALSGTISGFLAMPLITKFGIRIVSLFGSLLMCLSILTASYMTQQSHLALCFLGLGIGQSQLSTCSLYSSWCHFPKSKGKITGIYSLFFAFSGAIFSQITLFFVNPKNINPSLIIKFGANSEALFTEEISDKVPLTLQVLAMLWAILSISGSLLLSLPQDSATNYNKLNNNLSESLQNYNDTTTTDSYSEKSVEDTQIIQVQEPEENISLIQSKFWKSFGFWNLFMCSCATLYPGFYILFNFKQYGLKKFRDDHFMTQVNSIAFIFGGLCRFVFGVAYDKFGYKITILFVQLIFIFFSITLPFVDTKEHFMIWICVMFAAEGAIYVATIPTLLKIYGTKLGSMLAPYLGSYGLLSQILCNLTNIYLKKEFTDDQIFLFLLPAGVILGIFANCIFNEHSKDSKHIQTYFQNFKKIFFKEKLDNKLYEVTNLSKHNS